MSRRFAISLVLASVACMNAGCGTLHNLMAPPVGPPSIGPASCMPFGGVIRSASLGALGTLAGGFYSVRDIGTIESLHDVAVLGVSLVTFADVPLSLAGDIATLPVAYARSREEQWATWWGTQSYQFPSMDEAVPSVSQEAPDQSERKSLCPFVWRIWPNGNSEDKIRVTFFQLW